MTHPRRPALGGDRLTRAQRQALHAQAELCRSLLCCACRRAGTAGHVAPVTVSYTYPGAVPLCLDCAWTARAKGTLKLVERHWLPCLHEYFDWAKEGRPSGYFEHVSAGLAAVMLMERVS